ncbi:MAG: iron-containing alcohol dehydrogenase [bacterium]
MSSLTPALRPTRPPEAAPALTPDLEALFAATPDELLADAIEARTATTRVRLGAGAAAALAALTRGRLAIPLFALGLTAGLAAWIADLTLYVRLYPGWHAALGLAALTAITLAIRAAARSAGPHPLLGLGGGSALDLAKAVAWRTAAAGPRAARLVLAPTTAGSGAEVTPFASIWPPDAPKYSIDDPRILPDEAIIDPALTAAMPPALTAITGLDALVHAFETMIGVHGTDPARRHATHALHLIGRHLLAAITSPSPATAALALAATHAGLGLAQSRSAAAHALSYTLTARHGVPHGLAVGLLARALMPLQRRLAPAAAAAAEAALGHPVDAFIAAATARAALPASTPGQPDQPVACSTPPARSASRTTPAPPPPPS